MAFANPSQADLTGKKHYGTRSRRKQQEKVNIEFEESKRAMEQSGMRMVRFLDLVEIIPMPVYKENEDNEATTSNEPIISARLQTRQQRNRKPLKSILRPARPPPAQDPPVATLQAPTKASTTQTSRRAKKIKARTQVVD